MNTEWDCENDNRNISMGMRDRYSADKRNIPVGIRNTGIFR